MKEFPENFSFSTKIQVLIDHINYGNHVAHDKMVTLLQEARIRYLQTKGISEQGLIVTELVVEYLKEGFHGDILQIDVTHQKKGPCSAVLYYLVTRDGTPISKASTKIAFYDYSKRKIIRGEL